MPQVPPANDFQSWLQALQQLDKHLTIAITQASEHYGPDAAFLAADDGQVVTMAHLSQAAQREYQKLGRSWLTRQN
jgi:hypothetical protein